MTKWCWTFLHFILPLYYILYYFLYFVLFSIYISSFVKCLFRSLTQFLIEVFIFLLSGLVCKFSWHCLSQSIIFNFNEIQFRVVTKKSSPNQRSSRFSPIIFSRSFIVSCFTFRTTIYFELIFVKSVKTVIFFFFRVGLSSYPNTLCWKDHLSAIVLPLSLCQRSVDYCVHLFLGCLF